MFFFVWFFRKFIDMMVVRIDMLVKYSILYGFVMVMFLDRVRIMGGGNVCKVVYGVIDMVIKDNEVVNVCLLVKEKELVFCINILLVYL